MEQNGKGIKRSWIIGSILLLSIFGMNLLWGSFAPLLPVILEDLGMGYTEGGILSSVLALVITAVGLLYDRISHLAPEKRLFLLGMILAAVPQMLFLLPVGYSGIVALRLVSGLGMALMLPTYAALVIGNFSDEERPIINTVYGAIPYGASMLTLGVTVPVYYACGNSWRFALFAFGGLMAVFVIMWLFVLPQVRNVEKTDNEKQSAKGVLGKIIRSPQVWLLTAADFFDLWGYNFLSNFAPTFFTEECGMSLEGSSQLFAVFPVAGLIAGLLCGFWMSKVGLRKPFTWPMHLMIFVGTLMVAFCSGWLRIAGLFLAGFGNAGWSPALYTIPMEFKGMSQLERSIAYSFIFAIGHIAAFAAPVIGGWLGELLSLKWAMVFFAFAALFAAIACLFLEETGKKRNA